MKYQHWLIEKYYLCFVLTRILYVIVTYNIGHEYFDKIPTFAHRNNTIYERDVKKGLCSFSHM